MDKPKASLPEKAIHQEAGIEVTSSDGNGLHDIIDLQPISFSEKVLQHGRHPANLGRMTDADACASRVGWCGEVMEMYFRLDGNRISEATFWAEGCLSTMACGDMLTTLALGMKSEDAAAITPEELVAALDGLPFKSQHCAQLSVETLRDAIATIRGDRR